MPKHISFYLDDVGYEKNTFNYIKSLDKNLLLNKTFLDIGGNIGLYSLFLKKNYNSKIMVFEPDNNNLRLLYKTLKKNNFNNFFIFPFAISDKTAMKKMLIDDVMSCSGSISDHRNVPQQRMKLNEFKNVVAVKLDDVKDLNLDDLSLVKIDVEGHELQVIAGMMKIIKKYLPIIIVEIRKDNLENVKNLLFPLNYQIKKIDSEPNYIFFR